jgi:hypothetical protein
VRERARVGQRAIIGLVCGGEGACILEALVVPNDAPRTDAQTDLRPRTLGRDAMVVVVVS